MDGLMIQSSDLVLDQHVQKLERAFTLEDIEQFKKKFIEVK